MSHQRKVLMLHDADGEEFEINADDVMAVEDASSQPQTDYKTRIILSKFDADGQNIELLVKETAAVITKKLVDANAAGNWQGQ